MDHLIKQIREKEAEIWYLYLALQELKIRDPYRFDEQDFSKLQEACSHILAMVGETKKNNPYGRPVERSSG